MARNFRTEAQRERDRVLISEWYTTGKTQWWIAQELARMFYSEHGFTQQLVTHEVKVIIGRWQESGLNKIDEAKVAELAKINRLEQEYWDAWERSKEEKTTTSTSDRGGKKSAEITREIRDGNPAFLAGMERCIEMRCKIVGVFAPVKAENTTIDLNSLNDEQLEILANGGSLYDALAHKSAGTS